MAHKALTRRQTEELRQRFEIGDAVQFSLRDYRGRDRLQDGTITRLDVKTAYVRFGKGNGTRYKDIPYPELIQIAAVRYAPQVEKRRRVVSPKPPAEAAPTEAPPGTTLRAVPEAFAELPDKLTKLTSLQTELNDWSRRAEMELGEGTPEDAVARRHAFWAGAAIEPIPDKPTRLPDLKAWLEVGELLKPILQTTETQLRADAQALTERAQMLLDVSDAHTAEADAIARALAVLTSTGDTP